MLSVVVICGRTNVGKSTLFNRLLRSRRAVVGDRPGITLDCVRARAPDGRVWIDTAGLESGNCGVALQAWQRTRENIASGCPVVMVADARAGWLPEDAELAGQLRKITDPRRVLLAVNKAENIDPPQAVAEFHGLGFAGVLAVSAMHNQGIGVLREAVNSLDSAQADPEVGEEAEKQVCGDGIEPLKIALLGRPNVGKSTLANRITKQRTMLVDDSPGTTIDCVELPFGHRGRELVLIDMAGVRRKSRITQQTEESSVAFASQYARRADIMLLVLDASQKVAHQDKLLAERVGRRGNAVLVLLNKIDLLDDMTVAYAVREARRELPHMSRARFLPVCATTDSFNPGKVLDEALAAHREVVVRVKASRATAVLQDAISHVKPPSSGRNQPRLRFASQIGVNPPVILVHGRNVAGVPDSYRRYLAGTFAVKLGFANSVVHVRLSESRGRGNG